MTGATETMQAIQRLAPSFNFPRTTIADGSASVRPASAAGLGPDQVLVLINGKRRHTTALVHVNGTMGRGSTGADLNAIPVTAIERIEILRDGAAAQYGSDAIAGVINIVLKSGATRRRGSPSRAEPPPPTREWAATPPMTASFSTAGFNKGFKLGKGWVNLTAEYRDRGKHQPGGAGSARPDRAGDAGKNAVPQPSHWVGDPETTDYLTLRQRAVARWATTSFVYAFGGYS